MQPVLTPVQSVALYQALLESVLDMLEFAQLAPVVVCYYGESEYWQNIQQRYTVTLQKQVEGDLGEKMSFAASLALQESDSVVLVGADCPFMDKAYIEKALAWLTPEIRCVFGPATDGGYVLLGMRQYIADVFADIEWGTSRVLSQSFAKLDNLGVQYGSLEPLPDIDRPEDLPLLASIEQFRRWL